MQSGKIFIFYFYAETYAKSYKQINERNRSCFKMICSIGDYFRVDPGQNKCLATKTFMYHNQYVSDLSMLENLFDSKNFLFLFSDKITVCVFAWKNKLYQHWTSLLIAEMVMLLLLLKH